MVEISKINLFEEIKKVEILKGVIYLTFNNNEIFILKEV